MPQRKSSLATDILVFDFELFIGGHLGQTGNFWEKTLFSLFSHFQFNSIVHRRYPCPHRVLCKVAWPRWQAAESWYLFLKVASQHEWKSWAIKAFDLSLMNFWKDCSVAWLKVERIFFCSVNKLAESAHTDIKLFDILVENTRLKAWRKSCSEKLHHYF